MISSLTNEEQSLGHQQKGHVWSEGWINPQLIIVFPQVRKTFEKEPLQELADDIATNGVIQPGMVAKLTEEKFLEYVEVFEKISKTKLLTNDFPFREEDGQKFYFVLVAGERRYRAHQILVHTGCSVCKTQALEESKLLVKGDCFKKHFPKGLMEVRIGFNIDPEKAKSVQFRENNHIRPPVHEEAYSFRDFYDYLKTLNPKLNFKEFAIKVGVSVEKVRKALWFCELPDRAREAVEKKMVSYSNALELKKVMQFKSKSIDQKKLLNIIDSEIDFLLIHVRIKNDDYKKRIDSVLNSFSMPTLFDVNHLAMKKKDKRKIVEDNLLQRLSLMKSYSAKVELLLKSGELGKGKLYSGISPTKQVKEIADFLRGLNKISPEQAELFKKLDLDK